MKICGEFVVREIAGDMILVPTGETTREFNSLITLNGVAAFIWKHIEEVKSVDEMVCKILEVYEIDEETAKKDVETFCGELKQRGFIE